MQLIFKDILEFPSLKKGNIITGKNNLDNPVTGATIMEALDIEKWSRPGQVLLTSYYAFENLQSEAIDAFFLQAVNLGISGFIFKTDRLVNEIPEYFISKCKEYKFPLIQISGKVTYPKIINEILGSIINKNSFLLKKYYDNHQQFIKLMMDQADLPQILKTLENLIDLPVTLHEQTNENEHRIGTSPQYDKFEKIRKTFLDYDKNNVPYNRYLVQYPDISDTRYILTFSVPNLGYENYELVIHEAENELSDLQLMDIENTIIALQTELVKQYALRQNNFSHLNEMASELIFGRLSNKDDLNYTIRNLGLDFSKSYRVIVFNFNKSSKEYASLDNNRFTDTVANYSKHYFLNVIYVKQPHKLILILPIHQYDLNTVKDKLSNIIKKVTKQVDDHDLISQATISDEVSVHELAKGYEQAMDTILIGNIWDKESIVLTYDDIGIFKLFIETNNLEAIKQFVPKKILDLQKNNPDLLNTLHAFMNANQNYSETSKVLFVHPKTVRYRVDQLTERYNIHFDDPEEMLHYSIAIRIIHFLEYSKKE